jgi:hypothetical protein
MGTGEGNCVVKWEAGGVHFSSGIVSFTDDKVTPVRLIPVHGKFAARTVIPL